jgi:hypothetical protein
MTLYEALILLREVPTAHIWAVRSNKLLYVKFDPQFGYCISLDDTSNKDYSNLIKCECGTPVSDRHKHTWIPGLAELIVRNWMSPEVARFFLSGDWGYISVPICF